jgi:hypothetical protein
VATVPAGEPSRFDTPRNAGVARFAPYAASLRRAVCAVTHGGMGATQTALTHGFPACVVPFGRDQLDVAHRGEIAQAGSRPPARRLRPDRLRDKIHHAISSGTAGAGFDAQGERCGGCMSWTWTVRTEPLPARVRVLDMRIRTAAGLPAWAGGR